MKRPSKLAFIPHDCSKWDICNRYGPYCQEEFDLELECEGYQKMLLLESLAPVNDKQFSQVYDVVTRPVLEYSEEEEEAEESASREAGGPGPGTKAIRDQQKGAAAKPNPAAVGLKRKADEAGLKEKNPAESSKIGKGAAKLPTLPPASGKQPQQRLLRKDTCGYCEQARKPDDGRFVACIICKTLVHVGKCSRISARRDDEVVCMKCVGRHCINCYDNLNGMGVACFLCNRLFCAHKCTSLVRLPEGKVETCCNACKSTKLPTPEASQKNLPLDNLLASDEETENDSGGSRIPQALAGPPIVANGLIPPPLEGLSSVNRQLNFDAEESSNSLLAFLEGLPSVNSVTFDGEDQNQNSGSTTTAMVPIIASVPLSVPSATIPVVPRPKSRLPLSCH